MFLTFITRERFYILIFIYFWTAKIGIQKQCSLERRNDFSRRTFNSLVYFQYLYSWENYLIVDGWEQANLLFISNLHCKAN